VNWYGRPTLLTWLLWPASFVYGLVIRFWHALFDFGLRKPTRIEGATILSVGNLVVGGSGKTPVVIHLANEALRAGHRVAVLTRGYGRKSKNALAIRAEELRSLDETGDEPRLIARSCPGVTVFISADRVASAREAVKQGFNFLILDDGFQHRRLARDIDLLLEVSANGFLLPAGPLREPASHARRATHIWKRDIDYRYELAPLSGKFVLLLGVARPDLVKQSVETAGGEVVALHAYADHHVFTSSEIARAVQDTKQLGATLATTEKDAERLPPGVAQPLKLTLHAPALSSLLR
jgi:tetraacyldisaccharide 4'-kinase